MTGFGRGSYSGPGLSLSVELKTVNNRFLDVNIRLGSELQKLETEMKRIIGSRLARGRVDVNLQFDREESVSYEVNSPLISSYLSALSELKKEFELEGEPDINVIARLPNVLLVKKEDISEDLENAVRSALASALDDLEQMRTKEGELLAGELELRLRNIEESLGPIEAEAAKVPDEYRDKLTKRIGDMLARAEIQSELDQSRLAQEVAYIADRADISEEIARLRTHIEHFREIVKEDKEVGKRLDFLTQELNREANTITSKTTNMVVKENALKIKGEIEKIREQVQNVE